MTERDIELILAQNIQLSLRIDLLDTDYITIGELQGYAISLSPSISSTSDVRRIMSLKMKLPDAEDLPAFIDNLWLDRLIRPYLGIDDDSGTPTMYLLGTYLLSDNRFSYNATTQEVDMSLVDMMAASTESRGSQIGGAGIIIPAETNARLALIATVAAFSPFKVYSVVELPDTIPYDLEFEPDVYPYQILKTIMDFFPLYQMYYSTTGVFTVDEIPDGIGDDPVLDETVTDVILVSESRANSYRDVKNTTEIFGATLDAGYTATECNTVGTSYVLTISTAFETLEGNSTYSFTPDTTSVSGQTITIQTLDPHPIYTRYIGGGEAAISAGEMLEDVPYVVKYLDSKFYLQGESDIHIIVQEVTEEPSPEDIAQYKENNNCRNVVYVVNADSRFAADVIGDVRQVLKDGEYADIYTTNLAIERGIYENYIKARLTDSVDLVFCKPLPMLDVNQKISYTSPTLGEVNTVIVKEIQMEDFSNPAPTTSVSAIQYYPASPWGDL